MVRRDFMGSWIICKAMSWNVTFLSFKSLSSGFCSGWSNLCPPLLMTESVDWLLAFGILRWERLFFKLLMLIWAVWLAWIWDGSWTWEGDDTWILGLYSFSSLFVNELTPYRKFFFSIDFCFSRFIWLKAPTIYLSWIFYAKYFLACSSNTIKSTSPFEFLVFANSFISS